jgi:hypothetical protein
MRKRMAALILAVSAALVLIPGVANASGGKLCIRTHHVQIGYCP